MRADPSAGAVVVGAGIVGLASAYQLARSGVQVTVLEKEHVVAQHQTGRNSGVVHSGLYYQPGSLKARFAVAGARSMVRFARDHGIDVEVCGKLVVATREDELPPLKELHRRARANGVPARMLSQDEAFEFEPHLRCVAALRVESTAIIDYAAVSRVLAGLITELGSEVRFGADIRGIREDAHGVVVATDDDEIRSDRLVNCAGLYSDRVAAMAGMELDVRVIPFRGEYVAVSGSSAGLIRGLIYPVPDPAFPFLGVHLTRMSDGSVHAGPNAVLALAREGYSWGAVNLREMRDTLAWPGSWRLARAHWRTGISEVRRSWSRRRFAASLTSMVPEIDAADLVPSPAGVRAQAVRRDGTLVDDFHLVASRRQLHVLNAPSPAATAALEIGTHIVERLDMPT